MIIIMALIFILGIVFGSFFNVCIYRIPREESIAYPASHCTNCGRVLKPYELVPVLSYIFQGGKCRGCKEKISPIYPFVELLTGIVYLIIFLRFGFSVESLKYIFLCSILIISSMIDINTMEVYFKVSMAGFFGGIIFIILDILKGSDLKVKVLSILIPLLIMGLVYIVSKKYDGFGLGDLEVYLFSALYLSPKLILLSIFLSIIFGGILAIILMILGKRKMHIPFVPFIALGVFTAIIFGNQIIQLYLNLIL
ncbi:prepilin peptidase [Clostridium sp. LY3-2]|uniref:prepilin peptidase n=1 Tax=Clostridium sp. LY3-2 TaxID=2942482 RepID=UPI0021531C00|nr:A24 family peptidase [Clostridium sp. LY3-2]MCR6515579.1 prepilin peptidase [Clostridium sp. LY3-2]